MCFTTAAAMAVTGQNMTFPASPNYSQRIVLTVPHTYNSQ